MGVSGRVVRVGSTTRVSGEPSGRTTEVRLTVERATVTKMSKTPMKIASQSQPLDQREDWPRRPEGKLAQGPARPPETPVDRRLRPEVQLENWRFISGQCFYSLFWMHYVCDADTEIIVDNDDFAGGDGPVVDQGVDGLAGEPLQFDDGAGAPAENVADGHGSAAEFDGEFKLDIGDEVDVLLVLGVTFVVGGEFHRADCGGVAQVFA